MLNCRQIRDHTSVYWFQMLDNWLNYIVSRWNSIIYNNKINTKKYQNLHFYFFEIHFSKYPNRNSTWRFVADNSFIQCIWLIHWRTLQSSPFILFIQDDWDLFPHLTELLYCLTITGQNNCIFWYKETNVT